MREIFITKYNLISVDAVDDVVEICVGKTAARTCW